MRRFSFTAAVFFAFFLLSGCGKKGPILPPLAKIPKKIEKVNVFQRGSQAVLEWTQTFVYLDERPLTGLGTISIFWVVLEKRPSESEGMAPTVIKDLSEGEFEEQAVLLTEVDAEKLPELKVPEEELPVYRYVHKLSDEDLSAEKIVFGLRFSDSRKKMSKISKLSSLTPRIISLPPRNLKAEVFNDRIDLSWDPPEANIDGSRPPLVEKYNIYRTDEKGIPKLLNELSVVDELFSDQNFVFEETVNYFVRALASESMSFTAVESALSLYFNINSAWSLIPSQFSLSLPAAFAESGDSNILKMTPVDTFAPEPPKKVMVIATDEYHSVSWLPNTEKDLAGYHVWKRAKDGGDFIRVTTDPIQDNNFLDTTVEKGRQYVYAVTAVDKKGNESARSMEEKSEKRIFS
ncbi:MAG: fibronectin type III domain-containing protein [Candidatus Aminicenantes bacterium]|nr:fibronectin type III domain-containing protein [Candidatus Aminicenantes bacterium]